MYSALTDGKAIRPFNVIDEFNHEALTIEATSHHQLKESYAV